MLLILSLLSSAAIAANIPEAKKDNPTKCSASWSSYQAQFQTAPQIAYNRSIESTLVYSTWPNPVPTSTFCDGIPRILERQYSGYVTSWYTTTTHTDYWIETSLTGPTCTIGYAACSPFITSYSSALSFYSANGSTSSPFSPPCTTLAPCPTETGLCTINVVEPAKMYYWPVTVNPTGLCAKNPHTITGTPTIKGKPNTAVVDGMTFTSPYAYLSAATIGAFTPSARFQRECGVELHNKFVRIHPTDISTQTFATGGHHPSYTDPTSFNLVTLNWPVKTTSTCSVRTVCGDVCTLSTACKTPTFNPYNFDPNLLVPTYVSGSAVSWYSGFSDCAISGGVNPTWIPIVTLPGDPRFSSGWETPTSSPYFPPPPPPPGVTEPPKLLKKSCATCHGTHDE